MHSILTYCLAMLSVGTTYTVATTGADTNPGTTQAPFATLAKAATLLKAGDTVNVLPGNYAGFIIGYDDKRPILKGTADAPITFKGGPGVVITSRNNKTPNGIDIMACSYIVIDGFTVPSMPLKGIAADHSDHITVKNCVVTDSGRWGVYATHCDFFTLMDSESSRAKIEHGLYVANSCTDPTIVRCRFFDNLSCGVHLNGDVSQGGSGNILRATIQDNLFVGNGTRGGAAINGDGIQSSLISGNRLVDNKAAGITLFKIDAAQPAINNIVENNTVIMTPTAKYGLGIKNGSINNTVRNNTFVGRFAIVMTPDSLPGTKFMPSSSPPYSIDDGVTGIDLSKFATKVILPASQK